MAADARTGLAVRELARGWEFSSVLLTAIAVLLGSITGLGLMFGMPARGGELLGLAITIAAGVLGLVLRRGHPTARYVALVSEAGIVAVASFSAFQTFTADDSDAEHMEPIAGLGAVFVGAAFAVGLLLLFRDREPWKNLTDGQAGGLLR